uniref:Uncharacterized protein n=1 Tax=Lactuca sativa TaxID=4236 RepID=A0A9R1V150_LACSA|nr:hypothetical protein LSAT_V11C700377150 [Lactuca sativa]
MLVLKEEKFPLRHKLTTLFDIDVQNENFCKVIDSYMARKWKKKKVVARGKRKMETRNGSKSTIRYHVELGHDVESSSSHIETWRLTHWDEEKGWISTNMAAKYEEMKKMRNKHSLESMSDKLILEKHLSYDELVDELETMKREHEVMKEILIEKNIMPPPLSTSSGRSHGNDILKVVFLWILPLWIISFLVASGVVMMPIIFQFLNDMLV